jgi:hypothetical protein
MIPDSLRDYFSDNIKKQLEDWRKSLAPRPAEAFEEDCAPMSDVTFTINATSIGDNIIVECQGKKKFIDFDDDCVADLT